MKRNSGFFRFVMACMVFAFTFVLTGMAEATTLDDTYIKVIPYKSTTSRKAAAASGDGAVALGNSASASGDTAIALGDGAKALGSSAALGTDALASGSSSTALGARAEAKGSSSTALGDSAIASADRSVAIGYDSYTDEKDTVSVGKGTGTYAYRRIINVAAASNDNDAVNYKQAKELMESAAGISIDTTETSNSTVKVKTLKAGDNLTLTNDNGKGVYALSKNLTNLESVAVGGVKIDGTTNKITGIADGGIYAGSTEAVNGGQLYKLDQNIGYVGAHAAAMSALHAVPYNGSSRTTFTAGFGNYRGEQGYALGVFHYLSENVLANAAMSYNSGGDVMSRAGISFALGNGGHKKVSKAVCTEMEKKLAAQDKVINEQGELISKLQSEKAEQDEKIAKLIEAVELLKKQSKK